MKKNKYNKGDIVRCIAFVWTEYDRDLFVYEKDNPEVIHIPANDQGTAKKLLVRSELSSYFQNSVCFMVVGIKQIQTGYYYHAELPTNNWTGSDEGSPATFYPDYFHTVYVLETLQTERWQKVDFALEKDLSLVEHTLPPINFIPENLS